MRLCKWAGLGCVGSWGHSGRRRAPSFLAWGGGSCPPRCTDRLALGHTQCTPQPSRPALVLPCAVGLGFCLAKEAGGGQLLGCL